MKGLLVAILLLSIATVSFSSNAKAVDEIMDNVADESHVDHKAGVTQQDVIDAHLDTPDQIDISDIHKQIKGLKKRIARLSKGAEKLSDLEKA
jgi:TolA-binding protein